VSIISDALKRAHLETVSRERPQRWAQRTPGTVDYPEQRSWRGRVPLVLGAANVVLILLIGGVLHLRSGDATLWSSQQPAETRTVAPVQAHAAAPVPPAVEQRSMQAPAAPAAETPVVVASAPARNLSQEFPARHSPPAVHEGTAPLAAGAPVRKIALPVEASPRTRDGLVEGRTYVETVPLQDGSKLTLYGLTKAGGRGAALINGKVAWEGERVGDFVVERVERSRVQLRYGDIKLYLTLP
jgi:hypothetical protein